MKKSIYFTCLLLLLAQCNSGIKNENAKITQEGGTEILSDSANVDGKVRMDLNESKEFWVGYFEKDLGEEDRSKYISAGESFYWGMENKISISIDKIEGESVTGRSVVAGNDRPFTGTVIDKDGISYFEVKEPGDNKYDGVFKFRMNDTVLEGTWQAYKKIDISKRKYSLIKKVFKYDADRMLDKNVSYVDWNKPKKLKESDSYEEDYENFASATNKIYKINASNKLLTKKDVQNLKKGDISIVRNSIYARHGYSFKNKPLRVFFDAQDWYIPVYSDIKSNLTEVEKENIKLLLLYEKNAKEYYDYFGRN